MVQAIAHIKHACAICVRALQISVSRYREFLLDPGTIFTTASLLLLVVAAIHDSRGLVAGGDATHASGTLYLARISHTFI